MLDAVAGFILAGGESRRMGTEKARLVLDGQSFVERIARELSSVTSSIKVVGDKVSPAELNLPIDIQSAPDVYPLWGALGGVHAALSACSESWALVVACDFPFVTGDLFASLASVRQDFDAVAPIQQDGIPQPLCSLYRVEPCLSLAERLIKSGERKPITLLQSVRTRWVLFNELRLLKGADYFFDNINTPEDYARVKKKGLSIDDVAMG
ncbi:MAG TPA: molybdenum cofactor guanylyltransferase [Pyrinomonadaceae bacterium]|nr:molybdenum cofactor guanylyltransferase [Pyrinomonadaceae bacterium]